jgi:hypothetical protein
VLSRVSPLPDYISSDSNGYPYILEVARLTGHIVNTVNAIEVTGSYKSKMVAAKPEVHHVIEQKWQGEGDKTPTYLYPADQLTYVRNRFLNPQAGSRDKDLG